MRVLFAEDDAALGDVVEEALTDDGHLVTRASSADQVIALSERGDWDLFLLDSLGLGTDEIDPVTRATLALLSGRAPVVLASGRPWAQDADPSEFGVAAILPKPYDLDQMSATVAEVAARLGRRASSTDARDPS